MSASSAQSNPPSSPTATSGDRPGDATRDRVVDSRWLLQNQQRIFIDHAGQRYQLRLTRENKLILTK